MSESIRRRHQHGDHLRIHLNVDDDEHGTGQKAIDIHEHLVAHAHGIKRFITALGLEHDDIVINVTRLIDEVSETEVATSDMEAMATVRYISASHCIDINAAHGSMDPSDLPALLKLVTHELLHIAVGKVSGSVRLYAGGRKQQKRYDLADAMVDATHAAEEALVRKLTPLLWRELQ